MIAIILLALVPIYVVLLLGYTAGKFHSVDNTHAGVLNAVVMTYALPASLFATTAAAPGHAVLAQWPLTVILGAAMAAIYLLWYVLERYVLQRPPGESALQAQTVAVPNMAAAGLPLAGALLGSDHLVPVAIAIAAAAILMSPVTLAVLEMSAASNEVGRGGVTTRAARALGHALMKPIVLAPVAGIAISLLGWSLPPIATSSLRQIGQAAGGMALFTTGLVLSAHRFRLSRNTVLATAVVTVAQPLLAFGIARAIGAPAELTHLAVLLAALPSGFFGILFAANYGLTSEETDSTVIASTLTALPTLAVVIALLYK